VSSQRRHVPHSLAGTLVDGTPLLSLCPWLLGLRRPVDALSRGRARMLGGDPTTVYCTVHAWRQCVGTQSPRDYRSSSRFSHASNRRTRALRTAPRPLARRSWRARTDVLPLCRHANRMMSRNHGRIRVRAGRSGLAWRQDTWTCIPFDEESVHLPGHRGLVFGPATPPGVVLGLRPPQPTADIDPQARSHPVLRASVSGVGSR